MKRLSTKFVGQFKKKNNSSLTITDTLGSEPVTSTSTIIASTVDPTSSVASPATTTAQAYRATDVTTTHELEASSPLFALTGTNDPTPVDLEFHSERNSLTQQTGSGFFANSQNLLISGGTFVNYMVNSLPADAGQGKMKIPVSQKPNSSTFFTGRKDILDRLRKIFFHHVNNRLMSRHSCLLWGMGGIGKTQICLRFIEEMSDSFAHVFWVDASSHESITLSIKGISSIPAAQEAGMDSSVESVLQWISHIQEEWLMIFDNADDPPPAVVAKFIPPGNRGNILITSRNRSMGRLVSFENSIEIIGMEESDAVTLLLKASCLDHSAKHLQAAKEIVIELGCIPLAVDQAGAYIEAGKCSINNYLRQFSSHRQTLMSDNTFKGASSYDQTVYGTWDLSFKEIERRGWRASQDSTSRDAQAAKAAILILQICAFYHHSNISKDIFRSAAEESGKHNRNSEVDERLPQAITLLDHTLLALDKDGNWDDFVFGQGIGVLLSFSLMKREQSAEMLSVHPLMHCWSRERMSGSEQQRMYQMASIILSCAIPWRFQSEDYALRRFIFPHIKACELHRTHMELMKPYYDDKCKNFALVMSESRDWKSTELVEVQMMDTRKKLLGAEHLDTLTSMADLAITYYYQERWSEAEQLEGQVVDMKKKLLGAEHPDTLTSIANLASTYCYQRRWNEAEELQVQVMDMRKKLLGAEHLDTIKSMANLASTYWHQGRLNEAEQLEIQVIDMRRDLLGAEHPETLVSMENLATTYHDQRRLNEAEKLEVQVMNARKKLLGTDHPDTLKSMTHLASTYFGQGRTTEAEQFQLEVINITKRTERDLQTN